jgi:serine/threonine-protein kinase
MSNWSLPGYRELAQLGTGGFGRVVLAKHESTGLVVAIKYLFEGGDRAQFRHEAAILSRVVSPHVAKLYEFVEEPRGAAIVMEAVPGVSLKAIMDEHGALPPEAALAIMKGSLLGLAAAHAAGTVHRDYKPGNVLVQPNHQSKLVDFGIALLAGHASQSGTPAYMAPEQWLGGPATPGTDVYAATCVFFLCVTGERPFPGNDTEQLRDLHVNGRVPVELAPEPVRGLIARGMAKDVTQRPAGAAAFVAELESAAVAGYGKDWESKGWQRLAGFAGALLALSPMAWIVSATGVLTPGVAGGAAAGGALSGSAGAVAATKSAAGAVAAKVAAAVIGIAVAAGGTVIAVDTIGDDPPAAAEQGPFTVDTVVEQASYEVDIDVTAELVQVSNHEDPAVEADIDEELRRPVDEEITYLRESVAEIRDMIDGQPQADDPVTIEVDAEILLRNREFVSVRYDVQPTLNGLSDSSWQSYKTVTVDLRDGAVLTPSAMFRPEALTPEGMAELALLLIRNSDGPLCPDPTGATELDLAVENLGEELAVAFTGTEAEFTINLPRLGHTSACGIQTVSVPYEDLGDELNPEVIERLTAG